MSQEFSFDAIPPTGMAAKAEEIGVKKAAMPLKDMLVLSLLAGIFIALGALFMTTTISGTMSVTGSLAAGSNASSTTTAVNLMSGLPYGVTRLLGGLVFSLGLALVVVGGAELFTGNNLILMAFASKKVTLRALIRNLSIVYFGNFLGSLLIAYIMFLTKQYTFPTGKGIVGLAALSVADFKCSLGFVQAIALGTMCNLLVCMGVWMCYSSRSVTDKILAVTGPVACFIACGFEHSIANMYFIPLGLLIKYFGGNDFFTAIAKTPTDFTNITISNFFINNLIPVTIGNLIGGGIMVGLAYWFVHLRKSKLK